MAKYRQWMALAVVLMLGLIGAGGALAEETPQAEPAGEMPATVETFGQAQEPGPEAPAAVPDAPDMETTAALSMEPEQPFVPDPAPEAETAAPVAAPPVQIGGTPSPEARRNIGGTLSYALENGPVEVEWAAGIELGQEANVLGPLRQIWIYSQEDGVMVFDEAYEYTLEPDGSRAELTLAFTVSRDVLQEMYAERFQITPQGGGTLVERMM